VIKNGTSFSGVPGAGDGTPGQADLFVEQQGGFFFFFSTFQEGNNPLHHGCLEAARG